MRCTLLLLFAAQLFARNAIQVPWSDVCLASAGRPVVVTTASGETVQGRCLSVTVDEMSVVDQDQFVRIARSTVSRIQVHRSARGRRFPALYRKVHENVSGAFAILFSPLGPMMLVPVLFTVPATLAWGVAATPVCIAADIAYVLAGLLDIQVI